MMLTWWRRSTGMWRWCSTATWPKSGHLSAESFEQFWLLEWGDAVSLRTWCQNVAAWALRLVALSLVPNIGPGESLAPQAKVLGAKPCRIRAVIKEKGCTERLCHCLCMLCCHKPCMFLLFMTCFSLCTWH
jgi:hypothetical protein